MSIELIIAVFESDETKGYEMLVRSKELEDQGALKLYDVAAITHTKDGKVEVKDVGDVNPKRGAIFGAVTGGLIGLLAGPVGAVAGAVAGAATGRVSAKLIDYGVPDKLIKEVENGLQPGSSAVIAYVEMNWVQKAITRLEEAGAVVTHETMDSELVDGFLDSTGGKR